MKAICDPVEYCDECGEQPATRSVRFGLFGNEWFLCGPCYFNGLSASATSESVTSTDEEGES